MIISVASGKGGTGKTTISTNLAAAWNRETTYLDCDVEEPNGHIFLKPRIHQAQRIYAPIPQVDESSCDGCKKCTEICRFSAITTVGSTVLVFPELCHSCGGCFTVCPQRSISEGQRELGSVEIGTVGNIHFRHGILRVGEAMSPPLIREVKKHLVSGVPTIIDAPPGTSCPVITAIHGSDYVILVTEPTPFGLHDLKLAHETVMELGLPCGLVINKANLGDDGVQQYAVKHDIPVLLELPYSKDIARRYSKGELLIETMPEWKLAFIALGEKVIAEVERYRSNYERVCHS